MMLKWTNDPEGELAHLSIIICRIEDSFDYRIIVIDEIAEGEGGHEKEIYEIEGRNQWEIFNDALNWIKINCLP